MVLSSHSFLPSPFFFLLPTAQVTYNSQKREQRAFHQPGGGGVVDDVALLTGNHLQQRLNEIYSMSDDEDDMIESIGGEEEEAGRNSFHTFSSHILRASETGEALYGGVRQIKMQLGL